MNPQKKVQKKTPIRELVALHLIDNLGAQRIRVLVEAVEHPQLIFRMERHELQTIRGIGPKTAREIRAFNDWDEVDRVLEKTRRIGADLMTYWDDDYPPLLQEIFDPPVLLWIKGNRGALNTPSLSIVGTRKAGKYGRNVAAYFAGELVKKGVTVVSGLAYGIDGVAHKATVEAGGRTVAVLGSGIDNIYPFKHTRLAADITKTGGAVISEFPLGAKPDAGNFPIRNRIVSGISLGTLVVASGVKGGSMITAKSALDQNREVFVIPHPLGHPNSEGCNGLIKQGMGKLVQNVEDILDEIGVHISAESNGSSYKEQQYWKSMELDDLSTMICKSLQNKPLHADMLAEVLKMKTQELLPKLLELEIQKCVRQSTGKYFELV